MEQRTGSFKLTELLYSNPLSSEADILSFKLEGKAKITFPDGRMRMENALDANLGQKANFVYWCPENFPDNIALTWDFWPIREPGLCIMFFSAKGINGEDIFDPALSPRYGAYSTYHSSDINALHVSYFRRMMKGERAFHTCNLRKSKGFHLVSQGADPIPDVNDAQNPYKITLVKYGPEVFFTINSLPIFHWIDDGKTYGNTLGDGKIGFRQMAPLVAEYSDLKVYRVEKVV